MSKLEELKSQASEAYDFAEGFYFSTGTLLTLISVIEKQRKALDIYEARKLDSAHKPAIAEFCNRETDKILESL